MIIYNENDKRTSKVFEIIVIGWQRSSSQRSGEIWLRCGVYRACVNARPSRVLTPCRQSSAPAACHACQHNHTYEILLKRNTFASELRGSVKLPVKCCGSCADGWCCDTSVDDNQVWYCHKTYLNVTQQPISFYKIFSVNSSHGNNKAMLSIRDYCLAPISVDRVPAVTLDSLFWFRDLDPA